VLLPSFFYPSPLVWGKVKPGKGTIDIPIKRAERDRKKMEAAHMGKESQTKYEVIKYYDKMTLLKVRIITGRTHQIRVHFAGIGYPVVGDKKYGSHPSSFPQRRESHSQLNRQFLHAHKLGFELFGKKYHFKSDLPDDLNEFIKNLE
jgi:23S rRNA pseudouridine1911/1915/1917 synthase